MSFPKYPRYKDASVGWLDEVPEHWELARTKHLFELMKRAPLEHDEIVTAFRDGEVTLRGNRRVEGFTNAVHEHGYQRVLAGDLVIHSMDAFAGAIGVSDSVGKSSPVYSVCRANAPSVDARYYARLLRHMALSGYIASLAKGIRERSTEFRWNEAAQVVLTVPPALEQRAISTFLDRETAKIDTLITEQRRLIELLMEKRQAVISHAVTKGLYSDAPIRPSGVAWLGDVPAHWTVMALRHMIRRVEQGWSPEAESRPAESGEWGVLKAGCVNRGRYNERENKALPADVAAIPEYEVRSGDVLMSRASGSIELIGSTAFISYTRERLMLSDKIFRLRLQQAVDGRFFVAMMNSWWLRSQIERAISGAGGLANNLPQASLRAFVGILPPLDEQRQIVAYLDAQTSRIDDLIAKADRVITLLQERRIALISAAVTGKIDLRGLAEAA